MASSVSIEKVSIGHDCFLIHSFQLIIHQLLYYNASVTDSVVEQIKKIWHYLFLRQISKHYFPLVSNSTVAKFWQELENYCPDTEGKYDMRNCKNTAACRPVLRQRPRNKRLPKSRHWVTVSQTSMFPRQLVTSTEERCSLCCPCRDIISKTVSIQSVSGVERVGWWGKWVS
jgi:hypothetical protein